ncbi:MAG: succinate dehydrogenase cytochrome b subunit [Bacteroidales bacterium]|jgi:succinate dehydrogenase / fumarate reductase cytochrome b subunit|nr:succinate dehydrogenase cytochrome b subunit [Bacteroidales bacterium]MCI1784963.1 succinate dehydrogenase cytochrome b subunit [Bacteroidales bacterium]
MANVFHYSIGKKFIQSVSGAFLIIFLCLHLTINFFSVIDSFTGNFGASDGLFQAGCDFMSLPIVTIMVPVLAFGVLIHIIYGCLLTWENVRARGGYKRYEVASKAKADSWSAKNMFVLGIVILGILFFHLTHFWAHMQLQEFAGNEAGNPYDLLTATFGRWWITAIYIIWFIAIWFHLTHGFWSMFQTIGWSNNVWMKRLKVIGVILASLIALGFIIVAINAFLQAHFLI